MITLLRTRSLDERENQSETANSLFDRENTGKLDYRAAFRSEILSNNTVKPIGYAETPLEKHQGIQIGDQGIVDLE